MRRLKDLPAREIAAALDEGALALHVGPYVYRLETNLPDVCRGLQTLYGDFPVAGKDAFVDFDVALVSRGLPQRLRRRAEFLFDRQSPFDTIPCGQAYAFLEWGMNWSVSLHTNEHLKLHAAVVALDGIGVVMPGIPGAGKSTLCAALGLRGWRILSDEHALLPPDSTELIPLCRPVSLKNASIDIIREFSPDAVFGPVSRETHKGVVAHMKADLTPDSHDATPVPARVMLFPRYSATEPQVLQPRQRTESFLLAAYHSFNYSLLGEQGFFAMRKLIASVPCYDLVYRDLDWAVGQMQELVR
ncbi:MAG: HprK-related kinase A [Halioglobus sp.]|nr:HprK-related kinase A [Halioglobus sp.]